MMIPGWSMLGGITPEYSSTGSQTCPPPPTSHYLVTTYTVVTLVLVISVTVLYIQLYTLQDTVDNVNNKELEHLKLKLQSLSSDIQNISLSHQEVGERMEMLAEKVDRLKLMKDEQGELHYVMVAKASLHIPDIHLPFLATLVTFLARRSQYWDARSA